ncbi:MAG: 4'-phosphopantetheinyl transferase superfamily protein [Deltaproteobacteria bacterium]|nr:4'-phosphopantetheinyl transferase superfamily protein [Deltaproteobacteria bacterium]
MIFWHLEDSSRQLENSDEPPAYLLSEVECEFFRALRIPKRRRDWLLGRKTVKYLCIHYFSRQGKSFKPIQISVINAADGAPEVFNQDGERLPITVSLSHRDSIAVAALSAGLEVKLGIDLELCEKRPDGFASDFFTLSEVSLIEQANVAERDRLTTEVWSLKEAALKALRVGLRADTRSIEVEPRCEANTGWGLAKVKDRDGIINKAFVHDIGPYVVSVAWLDKSFVGAPIEEQELV